jgi:FkbH-like protein
MLSLLQHLPEPPSDFRQQCRAASDSTTLRLLAGFRLDGNQIEQLAQARKRLVAAGVRLDLDPIRLAVLSNASTDFFSSAFIASGLRHGFDVTVVPGDFGQTLQEASNLDSRIYQPVCDAVLLAIDATGLPLRLTAGMPHGDQVAAAIDFLRATRDAIKGASATNSRPPIVIFQSLAPQPAPIFGQMDTVLGGTSRAVIQDINAALRRLVAETPGDLLLDVDAMASAMGLLQWHSPKEWNIGKLQFSQQALPVYSEHLLRLLGAVRGRSKKCLVLDLDNTVWGGAVGDLGLDGIVLGQGSALGEAFLDVQRMALELRARGVVLAVCSKNDEANARQPFQEHPDMLLKEHHISVFQANWIDKATNLEEIARVLDIGVDSLVLLDDNPAERIQVRSSLSGVAVPELPDDPSLYVRTLLNAGYFEAVAFTNEDAKRADQYQANATRTQMMQTSRDPLAYLKALEMQITFSPFDSMNRARITQLINKTNQFNLTTRRYTEAEVASMETDHSTWTLQVRLVDKFGDNGMISVIICRLSSPGVWEIDTWLMSCRVLSRRVEECTMNIVVQHARKHGINTLIGKYLPTKKNAMVSEFYGRRGFTGIDQNRASVGAEPGGTLWRLDVGSYQAHDVPMIIESTFAT